MVIVIIAMIGREIIIDSNQEEMKVLLPKIMQRSGRATIPQCLTY
jgi:hypothetical protein